MRSVDVIRTHPSSSPYTNTDFDAANGVTFNEAIKYQPLPLDPGESNTWLVAPFGRGDFALPSYLPARGRHVARVLPRQSGQSGHPVLDHDRGLERRCG